jgi:regulator of nucleoside diphosphate kinase
MQRVPDIVISSLDLQRLEELLDRLPATTQGVGLLQAELARAEVREPQQMPDNVVTMNSKVAFEIEASGERFERTLCYPRDAGNAEAVSILAPMGCALLGLAVGQTIDWPLPTGKTSSVRVIEITYQPERAGDFAL